MAVQEVKQTLNTIKEGATKQAPLAPNTLADPSHRSLDKWNQRYQAGETAGVTRAFFPDAKAAYRIIGKMKVDRFVT
ncbi:unnamed protein product [Euphydryas editha]|uniref:Uncharacterized protein n=1 Tax=Euphydryas editha TaxID=104508 RepID=A0AAU9VB03_EUPED|nr:unnamed protein product [Euphydryas editha]